MQVSQKRVYSRVHTKKKKKKWVIYCEEFELCDKNSKLNLKDFVYMRIGESDQL